MSQDVASSQGLSKFPTASLRELVYLSLPLILSLFSASFMGFCDRFFLARYSLAAMQGSVHAGALCMLFQVPVMRIVAMSQVFVGLYYGSKQLHKIGPAIWQMIWISILSMIVTLPLSYFVAPFFFEGTSIEGYAKTYFTTFMTANFLFPLGTTLSSYFMGRGRSTIIFITTFFSHGLNIGLDYIFIFGVEGYFPSLGVFGAALASIISQFIFCTILLFAFIRKEDQETFQTHRFHFDWENFWSLLRVGLPRAIARVILLTVWVCISRLMTIKGGDHLLVLSVGASLILLFTFINDGMLQGMITVASNIMGSKNYNKIWTLVRSGAILLVITSSLLAIPYLFFPEFTLSFFFTTPLAPESLQILKKSCLWLWVFFFCYGVNTIGHSLVTASRDVTFYMFSILFVWVTSYLPIYIAIEFMDLSPDKLWLFLAFDSLIFGILFLIRASKEKWKERESDFDLDNL